MRIELFMINFGPKSKVSKKPKKKAPKASLRVPRRPPGYFAGALTAEDVAEINLFSEAIAKMNAAAFARRKAGPKVKA